MIDATLRLVQSAELSTVTFEVNQEAARAGFWAWVTAQGERSNWYFRVRLDRPFRPRTHGPKKQKPGDPGYQANHLNGHLSQLAIHFGYTKLEMKEIMKDDVPEWPHEPRRIGKRVRVRPVSEADVSVEVESKAIEWAHLIAGEEGIELKEE